MADLRVNVCGVPFKNPVIAASGTFGFGKEFNEIYDISVLGGISTKGLTLEPRLGNPTPRIAEGYGVILNAVGLQNPGVEEFVRDDLPFLRSKDAVVIANVAGRTIDDYAGICARLDGLVDMIELNISCPNVKCGGMAFGIRPESVKEVTRAAKSALKKNASHRQTISECGKHRGERAGGAGGRGGLPFAHQYADGYGHRHRAQTSAHCQQHGRRVGGGDPPDRRAYGI